MYKIRIPVANVPAYGTASVSQFTIALLLEIRHHLALHSNAAYTGRWREIGDWCFWDTLLIELDGKTMGIIGFGRIGRSTSRIARALGMRVLASDKVQSKAGCQIAEYVDIDTLLSESGVVVLHCPLFPDTENIICRQSIEKMKDGVILINNARRQLVVEADLAEALHSARCLRRRWTSYPANRSVMIIRC